jgi:hypothetical protein
MNFAGSEERSSLPAKFIMPTYSKAFPGDQAVVVGYT